MIGALATGRFEEETGSRGVLHPGKLRWLRALAWMVALAVLISVVVGAVDFGIGGPTDPTKEMPSLFESTALALASVGVYLVGVRLAERRWAAELDWKRLWELPLGLVIGGVLFSLVMLGLVGFDWYDLRDVPDASPRDAISVAIQSGVVEEVLFRAVIFRLVARAFNVWWALAVSAALFGAVHLGNPNADPFAGLAIAVEAGVMLGAFYVWSGRLWVPIGVHAAWNFFQGYVYGAAVSGLDLGGSLLEGTPDAADPQLLTGGGFGPEASLAGLVVGTATGVLVLWLSRERLRRWSAGEAAAPAA